MKNIIIINVKGKNIENFIKKLNINKINLLKIKKINHREVNIWINSCDYQKVLKLKTIYEINIVDLKGFIKFKKIVNRNKIFLIMSILALVLLYVLTNIIFKVEVIHNELSVRRLLKDELKFYGISEYNFVKSFDQINQIKEAILDKYKDKIEWLEIERTGTKYIVKLELRKINQKEEDQKFYHIIAKKDSIIKKIEATSGETIKTINQYVKKGDVIISGVITLNESYKGSIGAKGSVYGEVWYQVNVEYPLVYNETKLTGNKKNNYSFNFINKQISLFKSYKNKKITKFNIINNLFLPISLTKNVEEEQNVIEEINTKEQAIDKAILKAEAKINENLKEKEYIITSKVLSINENESKIIIEIFFTVYEDITDYKEIEVTDNEGNILRNN